MYSIKMSCVANTIVIGCSIICAFVGLALIIVGSIFYVGINMYYGMTEYYLKVASALFIAIGVIVFIIALGCCVLATENQWMLFAYAIILLILFTLQVAVGTYEYVQVNNYGGVLKVRIHTEMKQAFSHYSDNKKLFDIMQLQLKCCGVESPRDYFNLTIPSSCCGHIHEDKVCLLSSGQIYSEGCSTKLFTFVVDSVNIVAYVAFGIAPFQLIGAMFAIYRGRRLGHY